MAKQHARIHGHVTYREGDGAQITIPEGPCDITVTELDATIGWKDGDTSGSAALPLPEYTRYVESGSIVVEPAQE